MNLALRTVSARRSMGLVSVRSMLSTDTSSGSGTGMPRMLVRLRAKSFASCWKIRCKASCSGEGDIYRIIASSSRLCANCKQLPVFGHKECVSLITRIRFYGEVAPTTLHGDGRTFADDSGRFLRSYASDSGPLEAMPLS